MTIEPLTQLNLNYQAGISTTHNTLKRFLAERVQSRPGGFMHKTLAAEMDLSPSELSRKLSENPNDPRNFNIDDLEAYLSVTGDDGPIHYLIEKHIVNNPKRIEALEAELERLKGKQLEAVA